MLVVFTFIGLGFGSWLSRLPGVRDHLGATTFQMSLLGFTLAAGSVVGLLISGRTIDRLGPRRALAVGVLVQLAAMPLAATLLWTGHIIPGGALLAVYGFAFSTCDVSMNVSGAAAERALGSPRMPLLHGGFSLGSVASMGLGAAAEALRIPVPVHLAAMFIVIALAVLLALRAVPGSGAAPGDTAVQDPAHPSAPTGSIPIPPTHTGSIPLVTGAEERPAPAPRPAPGYRPWRDPRILAIGVIAMSMSLAEGTASDWFSLALADFRDFTNSGATLVLGVFFVSMVAVRVSGSWFLTRFGRAPVLRASALLVVAGVALLVLADAQWASVVSAILWGMGAALGFPVGISAAADDPRTAVRNVATVSAIAYTALLLGPMLIGFLGEHLGLLNAFWPVAVFAAVSFFLAHATTTPTPPKERP